MGDKATLTEEMIRSPKIKSMQSCIACRALLVIISVLYEREWFKLFEDKFLEVRVFTKEEKEACEQLNHDAAEGPHVKEPQMPKTVEKRSKNGQKADKETKSNEKKAKIKT